MEYPTVMEALHPTSSRLSSIRYKPESLDWRPRWATSKTQYHNRRDHEKAAETRSAVRSHGDYSGGRSQKWSRGRKEALVMFFW